MSLLVPFALFVLVNLLGAMIPGPDFAIVTRYGLTGSRQSAILATLEQGRLWPPRPYHGFWLVLFSLYDADTPPFSSSSSETTSLFHESDGVDSPRSFNHGSHLCFREFFFQNPPRLPMKSGEFEGFREMQKVG